MSSVGAGRYIGSALAVAAIIVACGGKISSMTTPCTDCNNGDSSPPFPPPDARPLFDARPPPPPPDASIGTCPTPADVSNFVPPAFVPPHPPMGACNDQQVQGYFADCFGNNMQSCAMFRMGNMSCASCIESNINDPVWGVIVANKSFVFLDIPGCVLLQGDPGCAKLLEQRDACISAACDAQCPVTDQQSLMDWQKCEQTAQAAGCKKYADAASMGCGAALKLCMNFQDFKTGFFQYATLFCESGG